MTYTEFTADIVAQSRAYIDAQFRRMDEAAVLRLTRDRKGGNETTYRRGMAAIGFHPLTLTEIQQRRIELRTMRAELDKHQGDTECARLVYAMQQQKEQS